MSTTQTRRAQDHIKNDCLLTLKKDLISKTSWCAGLAAVPRLRTLPMCVYSRSLVEIRADLGQDMPTENNSMAQDVCNTHVTGASRDFAFVYWNYLKDIPSRSSLWTNPVRKCCDWWQYR